MSACRITGPPSGLVPVHPLVTCCQQLVERVSVVGEPGGARADRQRDANARPGLEGMRRHGVLQLRHPALFMFRVAVPQHDDEFITGEPRAERA